MSIMLSGMPLQGNGEQDDVSGWKGNGLLKPEEGEKVHEIIRGMFLELEHETLKATNETKNPHQNLVRI